MDVRYPVAPPGFCLSVENIVALIRQLRVYFPVEFSVWNIGPNEPSVEQRNSPWHKTDPTTGVGVGDYDWNPLLGAWVKFHFITGAVVPSDERRIFVGDATDVDTYDGGEAGTVSSSTGPFWEIDTDFADKGIIGVGGTHTPVATDFQVYEATTADDPKLRTVYMLKPTGRIYDVA